MSRKKFIIIFNTWRGIGAGVTNDELGACQIKYKGMDSNL